MNTLIAAISLAVMVTLASGLGYNRYNDVYSDGSLWGDSVRGGVWDSLGSGHGLNGVSYGRLNRHHRRYRRAAVGYGQYDSYRGGVWNRGSGSLLGGRRMGRLGRLGSKWNRYDY